MSAIVAPQGRLLTAGQAAAFLGVTTSRVRQLIARRELAVMRTATGRLEGIYEAELRAWQTRRRQPAADELRTPQPIDERIKALLPSDPIFAP